MFMQKCASRVNVAIIYFYASPEGDEIWVKLRHKHFSEVKQ